MAILPWARLQGLLLLFKYKPTFPRFSCFTINNRVYANMTECISMFSAKPSLQKSSIMIEVTRYYVILIHLNTFWNKIFKNMYLRQDKADSVYVESRRTPAPLWSSTEHFGQAPQQSAQRCTWTPRATILVALKHRTVFHAQRGRCIMCALFLGCRFTAIELSNCIR